MCSYIICILSVSIHSFPCMFNSDFLKTMEYKKNLNIKKTFVLGIKIAIDNQSFYSFEMR